MRVTSFSSSDSPSPSRNSDIISEPVKTSLRHFQNELVHRVLPEKIDFMVVGAVANAFFGRGDIQMTWTLPLH